MFKNLLIGVAIFGLGWGASFGAGAAWARRSLAPPSQAQIIPAGQFGSGGAAAGAGGATGAGAGAVRAPAGGTVERLDGQTLLVAGPNGQTSRVTLTDQTQITKQGPASPADLTAGSRVAVASQGQPAPDGTITAATVTILPEGAAPQGQQGQQGQGGQRRPGQTG